MTNILRKTIYAVIIAACSFSQVRGAFLEPGYGTRGAGKGGAFIASADDASAPEWNPAALANVYAREGMFEYYSPFMGLPDVDLGYNFASVVYPVYGIANFGLSYTSFVGDDIYRARALRLTAAKDLSDLIDIYPMRLAAGLSFRYLSHEFLYKKGEQADKDDPFWDDHGSSANAFTADLGVLFEPMWEVPIGLSVKNIIPADVGVESTDNVPMEIKVGAGYRLMDVAFFQEMIPELAISYRDQDMGEASDKINFALGIEGWLVLNRTGFRAGVNRDEFSLGASYGWRIDVITLRLDYAAFLSFSELGGHFGHHRFSTSVRF